MLSGVQPCFQLLRIGSSAGDSARDLYTFRPAQSHSVFRLGRAAELCDVTLDSSSVSRIHAELHAEREGSAVSQEEGWRVHIRDRSSHGECIARAPSVVRVETREDLSHVTLEKAERGLRNHTGTSGVHGTSAHRYV